MSRAQLFPWRFFGPFSAVAWSKNRLKSPHGKKHPFLQRDMAKKRQDTTNEDVGVRSIPKNRGIRIK